MTPREWALAAARLLQQRPADWSAETAGEVFRTLAAVSSVSAVQQELPFDRAEPSAAPVVEVVPMSSPAHPRWKHRFFPRSSWLEQVAYDEPSGTLAVWIRSHPKADLKQYLYRASLAQFQAFARNQAPSSFYKAHVKGCYPVVKES